MRFGLPNVMSAIPSVTFVVKTSAFIGTSVVFKFHFYADGTELTANVMRSATSSGCETIAAWLDATLRISAPMRLAMNSSACGGIIWSSVATMYHDGRVFHAGGPDFPVNPQEAMIVRRANRGSTRWSWSLFAQSIQALALVQGKGGDVYQRFYARHAVRSSGNYDAAVGVTDKHDCALQHAEQVLRHRYICLDRSERQLSRHDIQTILLQQGDHFAPGRSVRPRSVYQYYVCFRFHYRPFRPLGCSSGRSRSCDIHVLI